jgi:hypothetical protein
MAGIDDPAIAELAGLSAIASGWDTDPLVSSLYAQCAVPVPSCEDAVAVLACLLATDLRAHPAVVTAPMIRLVAKLAVTVPESDLAQQCAGCAEYLDCDCVTVKPEFEPELESLPPLQLPSKVVGILARPLRSTLPEVQPPRGH